MFAAETIITISAEAKEPEGRTVPISNWCGSEFANTRNRPAGFAPEPSDRHPLAVARSVLAYFIPFTQ